MEGEAEIVDSAWLGDWEALGHPLPGPGGGAPLLRRDEAHPRALVRIVPRSTPTWAGPGWHPRYAE